MKEAQGSEAGDIERGAGCGWENLTGPFSATSDMKWATIIGTCWCAIEGSWMLLRNFWRQFDGLQRGFTPPLQGRAARKLAGEPRVRLCDGSPLEDFAETWAHYLHIVDTLEMPGNFGMQIAPAADRNGGLRARVEFDPLCDRGRRRRDPGVVSIRTRDEQPEPHIATRERARSSASCVYS